MKDPIIDEAQSTIERVETIVRETISQYVYRIQAREGENLLKEIIERLVHNLDREELYLLYWPEMDCDRDPLDGNNVTFLTKVVMEFSKNKMKMLTRVSPQGRDKMYLIRNTFQRYDTKPPKKKELTLTERLKRF